MMRLQLAATFIAAALQLHLTQVTAMGAESMSSGTKSSCPKGKTYDPAIKQCCTPCPPGTGVALPCSNGNDTVCAPCVRGKDYSATTSHLSSCDYCSLCPHHAQVVHECNETHNTRCRCESGYYGKAITPNRMMCLQCAVCPAGFYTARKCDHLRDTVCERCAKGSYSPAPGALQCRLCRACDQGVSKPCTAEHDTICIGSPLLPKSDRTNAHLSNGDVDLVPLYCFMLGSIVVGLIVYALLKRLNVCRSGSGSNKGTTAAAAATAGRHQTAVVKSSTRTQLLPSAVRTPSGDEHDPSVHGVYVGPPQNELYDGKMPSAGKRLSSLTASPDKCDQADVRLLQCAERNNNTTSGGDGKLCADALSQLQRLVAVESGPVQGAQPVWAQLAAKLGYNSTFIQNCGDTSSRTGSPPAHIFLSHWNRSNSSPGLAHMLRALRAVGRPDIADALCRDQSSGKGIITV